MASFGVHFLLSAILIHLSLITAQNSLCLKTNNYTNDSAYGANLNLLLSSLSSTTTLNHLFYNATAGQNSDKVYALFLCRGDVTSDTCRKCVNTTSHLIVQQCPNKKEANTWVDECMLRYSDRSIFAIMEQEPVLYIFNTLSISGAYQFNQVLGDLFERLTTQAAFGASSSKFATGEANFTEILKVYGLVQCTPDISQGDCNLCLRSALDFIPTCCYGSKGVRINRPSCTMRYELYSFYNLTASVPPVSPPPNSPAPPLTNTEITNGKGSNSFRTIVIVIVPIVMGVILLGMIGIFLWMRKPKERVEDWDVNRRVESLQFNFSTIRTATENFSDANKLGEGGFGSVYKGMLWNGQAIAVKRLSRNSAQGDIEFKNEVVIVANLQHRNLVRLLGFCLDGDEKLLIYEFVPNSSLDYFIFDRVKREILNWERRYKIIEGIARGLLYLHEDSRLRIIHRDLKASNILLDEEMRPKISDFGMARLFVVDQTQGNTSRIVGTCGYMAPEYAMHGKFSVRSDVYSFGVLVLEIVSGEKAYSFYQTEHTKDLLSYAWRQWNEGTTLQLMDPMLGEYCSRSEVMRCIHIGLLCVQENVDARPTMASVILMLNSHSTTLPLPSQPLSAHTYPAFKGSSSIFN